MAEETSQSVFSALTRPKAGLIGAPLLAASAALVAIGSGQSHVAGPAQAEVTSSPIIVAQAETGARSDAAAGGSDLSPAQRTEIEAIVRSYLLENPEILVEVSRALEQKQKVAQAAQHKDVIVANKDMLFRSDVDFVFGNPDGDVSVIEFFDYNCAWCKRALDQVQQLVDADPKVRVVMKEFPIFGEDSEFAARAAMASKRQGKYWPFHIALMKEKRVTTDNVLTIAADVGLDVAQLKKDMADPKFEQALKQTSAIAENLGIQGTPGFIVDTKVNVGYLPVSGLKSLVGTVREAGCQTC